MWYGDGMARTIIEPPDILAPLEDWLAFRRKIEKMPRDDEGVLHALGLADESISRKRRLTEKKHYHRRGH